MTHNGTRRAHRPGHCGRLGVALRGRGPAWPSAPRVEPQGVLDELNRRGWVDESEGALRLTPVGVREHAALVPCAEDVRRQGSATLPEDEYLVLVRLLARLVAGLPEHPAEGSLRARSRRGGRGPTAADHRPRARNARGRADAARHTVRAPVPACRGRPAAASVPVPAQAAGLQQTDAQARTADHPAAAAHCLPVGLVV